jgi:hypothetical protein
LTFAAEDEMNLMTLKNTPPWEWPENAGKLFLGVLRDRHALASDRLVAAELAGDCVAIDDALADALLSIVGNVAEPEELRARAATSLGPVLELADMDEFDDPDAVPITEKTFHEIQQSLRQAYLDSSLPKLVRRRILESSARASQEWHAGAIGDAYASHDQEWKLTAVFCMRWVRGFDQQILEALESADPGIHYEAVQAAGNWEVDAAWPHVAALISAADTSTDTGKELLMVAIEAVSTIRPREAGVLLVALAGSEDEDIAEAASEAMSLAEARLDNEFDDEEDEDEEDEDEPGSGNHGTIH